MKLLELTQLFEKRFAARPRLFRAPGRVNLIGEHTDYNDGFVMPAAVNFSTYVAIAKRQDRKLVIGSEEFAGTSEFDLDHLPERRAGAWHDYVVGVATILRRRGLHLQGANLLIHGEIPIGAGLSSSAAIEVASALAFLSLDNERLPLPEIARVCQQAENNFVGARVGIMDQFVSCMGETGHALLLDCRSLGFELVPLPPEIQLIVCNTMVKHDVAAGEYNSRRAECEEGARYFAKWDPAVRALRDVSVKLLDAHADDLPPTVWRRCCHVVRENQRTQDAARALAANDFPRVAELMRESHCSLRDLYEVSCPELDAMVDAAEGVPGFCGGRMTGGGFGGCTINLVRQENAADFVPRVAERYQKKTGVEPQIYRCSAENGAQALD
ncbi:MAG TPA: galactokinase [Verrucomicrobiae bacterium]|nr:galactokinase [Verrucomicrobiae bacterium]